MCKGRKEKGKEGNESKGKRKSISRKCKEVMNCGQEEQMSVQRLAGKGDGQT